MNARGCHAVEGYSCLCADAPSPCCCCCCCQAGLLGGLQEDTDTTHLRLRGLRKKVSDVIKQSRKDRQLCLILVLSVVLVVLTVVAIA
jgi:hypothetical protein